MIIGVPKEIKIHEYRVGLVPSAVRELTHQGHQVVVESGAAQGIGYFDEDYINAGAQIAKTPQEVFQKSDMIVKVKEPQKSEWPLLRAEQILFTFLHLAADPEQAQGLLKSKCIGISYDTVTDNFGGLPILTPMSEVAGRMSIQVGAHCLEKGRGGSGVLLGGVPGVPAGKVVIIGGGVVGSNAARVAVGVGAQVTIIDKSPRRLMELDNIYGARIQTLHSSMETIEKAVSQADLVIGAVLVPGATAPKIVSEEMVKKMRPGSVLVDVAIDQGGCFETSRPTTHDHPTYVEYGVVHYCVTNMPGAVARTSTFALNNVTLPFVLALANKGVRKALLDDLNLMSGLNVYQGHITHPIVARDLSLNYTSPQELLKSEMSYEKVSA